MPTETYYHLPDEKREKIRRAVHTEFARVPYEKVSINRIVQDAQIPRGSFYQYFGGKEDLFEYLLQEYHDEFMVYARRDLAECGGDPFAFTLMLFDRSASFIAQYRDECPFYRNLIGNLRFQDLRIFRSIFDPERADHRALVDGIDRSVFRDASDESFLLAMEVLQTALQQSVCRLLMQEDADASAERARLEKTFSLVSAGFVKKEGSAC